MYSSPFFALCRQTYVLLVLYTLLYCLRFQRHRHIYIHIKTNFYSSRFSLDTGRIAVLHRCELITTLCKHLRGQQPQAYLELHGYTVPSGDISRWTREPPALLDQPHQVLENGVGQAKASPKAPVFFSSNRCCNFCLLYTSPSPRDA